jgi:hypothetical protein
MAKLYKETPSELLNITDPIERFCLNRAIHYFGSSLENELNSVNEKTAKASEQKRQRILQKWIPEASAGFRDPAKNRIG